MATCNCKGCWEMVSTWAALLADNHRFFVPNSKKRVGLGEGLFHACTARDNTYLFLVYLPCVHVCVVSVCMCTLENQRTAMRNLFSSSTMWIPGMEFRSPSLVASAFYPLSYPDGPRFCSLKTSTKAASFLGKPKSASQMGKLLSLETD